MPQPATFSARLAARFEAISPAERIAARFFLENREDVLISSASIIAKHAGISDATVVRAAKALGFSGLDDLRKNLAREIRETTSPASRMARTIREVGDDLDKVFQTTLDINQSAIEDLRTTILPNLFQAVVEALRGAQRVFVFGIGPSGAMAEYLALGLTRLGLKTKTLTRTGLSLADDIGQFERGDLLILFAYGTVYGEVTATLDQADLCCMPKILVTDSLGPELHHRVDHVLPVIRGRINQLSMHTATIAFIEALIVGVAARQPEESLANLADLNRIRQALQKPMKNT